MRFDGFHLGVITRRRRFLEDIITLLITFRSTTAASRVRQNKLDICHPLLALPFAYCPSEISPNIDDQDDGDGKEQQQHYDVINFYPTHSSIAEEADTKPMVSETYKDVDDRSLSHPSSQSSSCHLVILPSRA